MTNGDYEKWKTNQAEFYGYSKAQFENIHSKLDDIKETNAGQSEKIDSLEKSRDRMKGGITMLTVLWAIFTFIITKFKGG